MTPVLSQHRRRRALRDVEEASEVYPYHCREIGFGIVDERLREESSGIVHQRVDAAESVDRSPDDAAGRDGERFTPFRSRLVSRE
jgi:hypothetical protein